MANGSHPAAELAEGDRLAWRRRLRRDRPGLYRLYRWAVAVVGTLLLLASAATGWLPGPGGIPLLVLGLAVLATEYPWARRLLGWTRDQVQRFGTWSSQQPRWLRRAGAVLMTASVAVAVAVAVMVVLGVPSWAPFALRLDALPGLALRR